MDLSIESARWNLLEGIYSMESLDEISRWNLLMKSLDGISRWNLLNEICSMESADRISQ